MKKWIALIMAVIMALSLFAGCGSAAATGEEPVADAPAEEPAEAPAEEPEEEPAEEPAEELAENEPVESAAVAATYEVDGKTYVHIASLPGFNGGALTDDEFSKYFKDGDAEAGINEIVKNGLVFCNGQRIPYVLPDGSYSSTEMRLGTGHEGVWQEEDNDEGWAWFAHVQRRYNEDMWLPSLEPDFEPGRLLSLQEAGFMFVKYLMHISGQTVELYAEEGTDYAGLITTTFYQVTLIHDYTKEDGFVHFTAMDNNNLKCDLAVDFPQENVDPSIKPEDMIVYWNDEQTGWHAIRAVSRSGFLIENTDPNDPDAYKHPYFLTVDGQMLTTGDSFVGKDLKEAFTHTQFMRGHRRTDQYNFEYPVIMWSSNENPDTSVGFTRGDNARPALEHAVAYCEDAVKDIVVSEDGTDVPTDVLWVPQEAMDAFNARLAEAKAMLEEGTATNFEYDEMLINLANDFGGVEDKYSTLPFRPNPLGVMGSAEPGTMG